MDDPLLSPRKGAQRDQHRDGVASDRTHHNPSSSSTSSTDPTAAVNIRPRGGQKLAPLVDLEEAEQSSEDNVASRAASAQAQPLSVSFQEPFTLHTTADGPSAQSRDVDATLRTSHEQDAMTANYNTMSTSRPSTGHNAGDATATSAENGESADGLRGLTAGSGNGPARRPLTGGRPALGARQASGGSNTAGNSGVASGDPRSISFKKRAGTRGPSYGSSRPNTAGSAAGHGPAGGSGGAAGGVGRSLSGFLFGKGGRRPSDSDSGAGRDRPRKSFAAASQASADAIHRWRNMRRVQTLSVHPPTSGDPEDPSSWSFPEAKPQIPSLLPNENANPDATPIPLLPFTVLCLVCFGEFSSSGVAGPFLFFMIDSFGVGGEADVGFWAGIVSSVFWFAQFLTSLLWASIADRYGRRAVLLTSLCGNALTLITFGTSTNLKMAITVRLAQGLFNGAVGVAKGAIRDLTDQTNEGRAYAILGFAWGFGGIAGPILGGLLEHPADKFPALFGDVQLLKTYPYLLPCLVGACFTSLGAFLSLFIGPDGGPRQGQIRLQETEAEEAFDVTAVPAGRNPFAAAAENIDSFSRHAGKRISGYLSQHDGADGAGSESAAASQISLGRTTRGQQNQQGGLPRTFTQQVDEETGGPPSPVDSDEEGTVVTRRSGLRSRAAAGRSDWDAHLGVGYSSYGAAPSASGFSRTEERRRGILGGGSAYGYDAAVNRHSRISTYSSGGPTAGQRGGRNRGPSFAASTRRRPQQQQLHQQRLTSSSGGGRSNPAARYSYTPSAMGSAYNYAPDFEAVGEDPNLAPMPRKLNFAQRFLLANDDAVLSITDLWVAAAINGDDGGAYPPEEDEGAEYFDEDDEFDEGQEDDDDFDGADADSQVLDSSYDLDSSRDLDEEDEDQGGNDLRNSGAGGVQRRSLLGSSAIDGGGSTMDSAISGAASGARNRPYLPPLNFAQRRASRGAGTAGRSGLSVSQAGGRPRSMRLPSFQGGARVPSLYNNMGIDAPAPWLDQTGPDSPSLAGVEPSSGTGAGAGAGGATNRYDPTLAGIPESHSARNTLGRQGGNQLAGERQRLLSEDDSSAGGGTGHGDDSVATATPGLDNATAAALEDGREKAAAPPSLWALLPLTIIAHYSLLAFHSATFDQVFMAFLVTPYPSGGLGLTAAHYAELISAMAFCQIGFQFYFYPQVGPPRGKLSHLSMMRLGTLLYLPTYTLFPLLRRFLHPQTDALVMSGMILFASMRWMANICAFTAVSILMNALTPPNLVPLANGLAQTTSSACRFLGPILGGLVWAKGISGDFEERAWPWNYHLGFWFVGLAGFTGFLHATFVLKASSSQQ